MLSVFRIFWPEREHATFSTIFRGELKKRTFCRKVRRLTLSSPRWVNITKLRLFCHLEVSMAEVAEWNFHLLERHGTKSRTLKSWEIKKEKKKRLPVVLGQKCFQVLVFKAFENGKGCDFVNRQPVQTVSTGRHLFFFKLKQLIFRLILVNNDKQRYSVNFFFLLFLSFILQPESTCQLINMAIDTGTIIKTTSTYVYAANDSVHYFLCFSAVFFGSLYSPLNI